VTEEEAIGKAPLGGEGVGKENTEKRIQRIPKKAVSPTTPTTIFGND